jgi:hypothetical protein
MFPETYGRTLEELAFLFEDHALAEEATSKVEKQMEWTAERWSRVDERMSWDMDVIVPNKYETGRAGVERGGHDVARVVEPEGGGNRQAIRGERGGWWNNG